MTESTINSTHSGRLVRNIKNFMIIWLDSDLNKINSSISELHPSVNYYPTRTFNDIAHCIDCLTLITDQKLILISTTFIGLTLIPRVHDLSQLNSIYLISDIEINDHQWIDKWNKIQGIFTDISIVFDRIKHNTRQYEENLTPISILSSSITNDLNELDQSFMYSQLLKEILFQIEYDQTKTKEFLHFFRDLYKNNKFELAIIDEFECNYQGHSPIWWYTRESFIYSMLNQALRTQDTEILIKMGFFTKDLHQQIQRLHNESEKTNKITVYRGQGLANLDFEKIKTNQGGLLSFNNFLSTSTNQDISLNFANNCRNYSTLTSILFVIEVDPSISTTPFASVENLSYFSGAESENEILFSMHSIFRIGEIKKIDDDLWQISLSFTNDNDEQLQHLAEQIRKETWGPTGWRRLGQLMVKIGEFDKAEEIYKTLIETTDKQDLKSIAHLYHQIGYIFEQKQDFTNALNYYKQSLDIELSYLPSNDPSLSAPYNNIGGILYEQGDFNGALDNYHCALHIDKLAELPNHMQIATAYNNIGLIFMYQEKYQEALNNYQQAMEIIHTHLPSRHPLLGTTYTNIGGVYQSKNDNSKALDYFEKALEIYQKSLPSNHPLLALSHHNLSGAFDGLRQHDKAVEHGKCAVDIARHSSGDDQAQLQMYINFLDEIGERL